MQQQKLHLIAHELCPYVQRSVIVLQEKGITYKRTDIDLSNTPKWFRKISPMGQVPILLVNDDKTLFESAVICEYLDEITPDSLHPLDPLEKAYHRAWIEFGSGILNNIAALYHAETQQAFEIRRLEIQQKFQLIEKEINGSPYFSGEQFQFIDAVYGPIFRYFDVFDKIIDLKIFNNLPKLEAWRHALQQRPSNHNAVIAEYPELLLQFLVERNSYISRLVTMATI